MHGVGILFQFFQIAVLQCFVTWMRGGFEFAQRVEFFGLKKNAGRFLASSSLMSLPA
jgi:hypothetical protein